jgi:uncharacterized protein YndB with AHSA1/START domain
MSLETRESQLRVEWTINAPTARVWESLTTPSHLAQWLGKLVSGEISSESSFAVDHGDGYQCDSTVVECEPFRALSYSWKFPDEPHTELSWNLLSSDNRTTLTLTHSGLSELLTSYRDGWPVHLTFLEASTLGTPLPWTMFWHFHSTIAYLNARDQ